MYHPKLMLKEHTVDVCVIGGGMAGLCAALAAARHGAKTMILQDRPMLGGNASSEVRMWICGARGKHDKETGILEELQLENLYYNAGLNYPVWDALMLGKVMHQPNLAYLLNCSCLDAQMDDDRIISVTGWQLTSQTFHRIHAKQFIDCSGDSILAPLTGALHRWGRESSEEFGEDIQPKHADHRTMGNSLLIQLRRTDTPQPYIPPKWAYKFTHEQEFAYRLHGINAHNFWWVEIGGINNTIHDAEWIRDELMKICYGVWDYMKNHSPEKEKAANWELYWVGRVPGKRENRRYVGDHILTQHDIESHGRFEDTVAYGGWPMDDHHPAGMLYPKQPTIFHPAPSPYGIAYRSLYSKNIANLFFAGRNISVTHAALSSTRVMGTCAILGQAVGTAAAIAVEHDTTPRSVYENHLSRLQQTLMDDDCFLPEFTRRISPIATAAKLSGDGQGLALLLDGMDRDRDDAKHAWEGKPGDTILFEWNQPTYVGMLRCTFDSNLHNDKRLPCAYPQRADRCAMPKTLVKAYRVQVRQADGSWKNICHETLNLHRLVRIKVESQTTAVRFIPEAMWGDAKTRIFAIEPIEKYVDRIPIMPEGETFQQFRDRQSVEDMADPPKNEVSAKHRNLSA